jgi:hypothetical protein
MSDGEDEHCPRRPLTSLLGQTPVPPVLEITGPVSRLLTATHFLSALAIAIHVVRDFKEWTEKSLQSTTIILPAAKGYRLHQ